MTTRNRLLHTAHAVLVPLAVSLAIGGCDAVNEPGIWSAQQISVTAFYDTVPTITGTGMTPLIVRFDTTRSVTGYPVLHVAVRATNLSDEPLVARTGASCHWMFSVYDNAERAGTPLWEETEATVCRRQGMDLNIQPGETIDFPTRWLPFDSIAVRGSGTYFFSARLRGRLEGESSSGWLTERLPVGEVELRP